MSSNHGNSTALVLDQLTAEQVAGLRLLFKKTVKEFDNEQLSKLEKPNRKRHRAALSMYYTRLFRVSNKPHPRRKRPRDTIKHEAPDMESLSAIQEIEEKIKQLSARNEELKKQNQELQSSLVSKVAQIHGKEQKNEDIQVEPPTENSNLKDIEKWLLSANPSFEHILEELNGMDEKTRQTCEKTQSLISIASTRLKPTSTTSSSSEAPSSSTSSAAPSAKLNLGWGYAHRR